jgi:hypothetical protein
MGRVDWNGLSENPAAIELLSANLDKVDWWGVSTNSAIFELVPMDLSELC